MAVRTVVSHTEEVTLDRVSDKKGYAMLGEKGIFILSKDTEGKYIWVRLNPPKVSKPVHSYENIVSAIQSKLEVGYDVVEYDSISDLVD